MDYYKDGEGREVCLLDAALVQSKCNAILGYYGINQIELAKKLDVSKQTISALLNEGRGLTTDRIQKFCDTFFIDARFFFGQLDDIQEADLTKRGNHPNESNQEMILQQLKELQQQVRPPEKLDPIAERVVINQPLRELVELIQFWDGHMLRRFKDIAYGFVSGQQYQAEQKEERKKEAM